MTPPDVAIEEVTSLDAAGDSKSKKMKALAAEKSKENEVLQKWSIKVSKAMYELRTAVKNDLLKYIREATTLKIS